MKKLLLLSALFICGFGYGQSKKKQIAELQSRLSQSILNESTLRDNIKQLESEKDSLRDKVIFFFNLNEKNEEENEEEKNRLIAQLETTQNELNLLATKLSELEDELGFKNDSISLLKNELQEINTSVNGTDTADFLNNYANDRQPLNNNTFNWELKKIITYPEFNSYYHKSEAPSLFDVKNFYLAYVTEGIDLSTVDEQSLTVRKPISFLNSMMPKIEVLKNKLVTIKFKSGEEESLLFNLKSETNQLDESLRITLASEESDSSEDIIWNIRQIDNEYYIALDYNQLRRLELSIKNDNSLDYYYYREQGEKNYSKYYSDTYSLPSSYKGRYTVESFWLIQKKNNYIEEDMKIRPNQCVYLFKLLEE
jgi:hypothetical protein